MGTIGQLDGSFALETPLERIRDVELVEISYTGYDNIILPVNEINNKHVEVTMDYDRTHLLGDVVIARPPLHKRVWRSISFVNKRDLSERIGLQSLHQPKKS